MIALTVVVFGFRHDRRAERSDTNSYIHTYFADVEPPIRPPLSSHRDADVSVCLRCGQICLRDLAVCVTAADLRVLFTAAATELIYSIHQ